MISLMLRGRVVQSTDLEKAVKNSSAALKVPRSALGLHYSEMEELESNQNTSQT